MNARGVLPRLAPISRTTLAVGAINENLRSEIRLAVGLAIVDHLRTHPGSKPTVQELAAYFCLRPRQLRRYWRRSQQGRTLRWLITAACVHHAWSLMSEGTKCEAAIVLSGFKSRWNFNRQSRLLGGRGARECRHGVPVSFTELLTCAASKSCSDRDLRTASGPSRKTAR